ncbi:pyridoxamine 5'-phosphate oxidase family protein [Maribacter sp. ACAM166]|uniref:pyridoxamine 5'-phosphate oxidase family protein n=1 Tax=Maribacter sp. ACAM166 TaxID=2508996 RepID=UPI0010FE2DFD|nr:pyridoxamine 5'-phosphate oxidase family protein [Maribacter sp. ACAM166]TLP74251.1 flavin mononucleotide-binding protein [Maribacter sp. ACAM166]
MENLSNSEIITLLKKNYLGHLAYISNGRPSSLPITYYFDEANNAIISYSSEGHKIDSMRENGSVSLQVEEVKSNSNWLSVLVHGTFEELSGSDAKSQLHQFTKGVKSVITKKEHSHPEFISEFSSKLYLKSVPIVYRINIIEITGKRKET